MPMFSFLLLPEMCENDFFGAEQAFGRISRIEMQTRIFSTRPNFSL